jgi:thioredoxin 1
MKESKWNGLLPRHAGERGDSRLALVMCLMLCITGSKEWATEAWAAGALTVERSCPGLSSGPLRAAHLAHLPKGVVLRSTSLQITQQQVTAEIQKAPERVRQQVGQNAFFVLEQLATRRLLLGEARRWAAAHNPSVKVDNEDSLIREYLQTVAERASVSDEEVRAFYSQNKELVGGAPFESVRDDLKRYLLGEKQQAAVEAHIHRLAERAAAEVDEVWTKQHCRLAMDNPVDKARRSGKPTLVDFGANGCKPCDMMTPILAALKKKYAGRLNVLFVHVQEEQILAARYGVRTIPVQVFFDREGKEVFRHEGFFPQDDIERKLTEMGIGK